MCDDCVCELVGVHRCVWVLYLCVCLYMVICEYVYFVSVCILSGLGKCISVCVAISIFPNVYLCLDYRLYEFACVHL